MKNGAADARAAPNAGMAGGLPWQLMPILAVLTLAPLLLTRWPPLLDYVPHLARVHILHDLLTGGHFADRYQLAPGVLPNLGIEAGVLPLILLGLDVSTAGRIFVAGVIVATSLSVVALHRALFGRRSVAALAAFVYVYNPFLMTGFLACTLSFALAFAGFAAWLRWRGRLPPARMAGLLAAAAGLLFFCHLLGALMLLGLVASYDLSERVLARAVPRMATPAEARGNWRGTWAGLAAGTVLLGVLFAASPLGTEQQGENLGTLLALFRTVKLWQLWLLPQELLGYAPSIDVPVALLLGVGLVAALAAGCLRIAWPMLPGLLVLLALLPMVPEGWHGLSYIPDRLPYLLLMLGIASIDVVLPPAWQRAALVAMLLLIAARTGSAAMAWHTIDRIRAPVVAALASVPREAVVCGVNQTRNNVARGEELRFPFMSMAALATVLADAFSPSIFVIPGQNPVVARPAWRAVVSALPRVNRVDHSPQAPSPDADMAGAAAVAACDYMLATRPELYQLPIPPVLQPLVVAPGATLFRVRR